MQTIAVIGLGAMGAGMARNLLKRQFPVVVYNRTPERARALAREGAVAAGTPREAAETAAVVLSMVADDAASRAVWMGPDGALAGARAGAVLIESSTLSPPWIAELAAAAAARGCEFLDAPVTGSKPQAESGELLFLVGGDEQALAKVRDALAAMSRGIVHLGPTGSGALMKLINNFLCATQAAALAEVVSLIERSGLDRTKALDILNNGAPGSPMVRTLSARMAAQDYEPRFSLRLMCKDIGYAIDEAARRGVVLRTGPPTLELYRAGMEKWGDRDIAAVVEPLR